MNITALVNRSADIITQYYQNNITPFLEAFHDDALWIGPAEKQILRTRDSIREAFCPGRAFPPFHSARSDPDPADRRKQTRL